MGYPVFPGCVFYFAPVAGRMGFFAAAFEHRFVTARFLISFKSLDAFKK